MHCRRHNPSIRHIKTGIYNACIFHEYLLNRKKTGLDGWAQWFCEDLKHNGIKLKDAERLASLGIVGAQLRVPLKPPVYYSTIVLRGLRGAFNWIPIFQEKLVSRTVNVSFWSLRLGGLGKTSNHRYILKECSRTSLLIKFKPFLNRYHRKHIKLINLYSHNCSSDTYTIFAWR